MSTSNADNVKNYLINFSVFCRGVRTNKTSVENKRCGCGLHIKTLKLIFSLAILKRKCMNTVHITKKRVQVFPSARKKKKKC